MGHTCHLGCSRLHRTINCSGERPITLLSAISPTDRLAAPLTQLNQFYFAPGDTNVLVTRMFSLGLIGLLRRLRSPGLDWFNLFGKGFGGKSCPVGPAKPIEVKGHDKTVSRYGENQWTREHPIFLILVIHNFSPNHSGCEQFSCERDWRHLFRFETSR